MAFVYGVFYRGFIYLNSNSRMWLRRQTLLTRYLTPYVVYLTTIPTIYRCVQRKYRNRYVIPFLSYNLHHIGGLHYIGLGAGLTLASQINARYMDKIYVHFKNKSGGVGFRVPSMIVGSLLLPFGLLMSGWASEEGVHWIVTDIVRLSL